MELKRQVLATTHVDAHGEKLTKDELVQLCDHFSPEMTLNNEHDLSLPPIATAFNLTIEQTEDGEWRIIGDVIINDESAFKNKGGFSMSWLADIYTTKPNVPADIEIYFNPRHFSENDALLLIKSSDSSVTINARQLKQKALEPVLILIIKFVSASALVGFFGKAGSDAYDGLKKKLASIISNKEKEGKSVSLQIHIPNNINPLNAELILEVPGNLIEYARAGALDFESAVTCAKRLPYSTTLKKVVITSYKKPPKWQVKYYIKGDGSVVKI